MNEVCVLDLTFVHPQLTQDTLLSLNILVQNLLITLVTNSNVQYLYLNQPRSLHYTEGISMVALFSIKVLISSIILKLNKGMEGVGTVDGDFISPFVNSNDFKGNQQDWKNSLLNKLFYRGMP